MLTIKQKSRQKIVLALAYKDFNKGLNSHAFFKLSSHTLGQDLVQETYMKTWNYLLRGGKITVMKAFLYHVLNNLIVDEYRKRKATSLDILLESGFEPSVDDSESLYNTLDGRGAILLIKRLPKIYQEAMRMRYIQDLSLKEMSVLTGQSNNTLAVQLHRGLGKLKVLYNNQ